jgi:hypothetical protein
MIKPGFATVGALVLATSLLEAPLASAVTCRGQLVICMLDASDLETFWERSFAGLACGAEYFACLARNVTG